MALWRNALLITFYFIAIQQEELTAIGYALICGHAIAAISMLAVTLYTEKSLKIDADAQGDIPS
jgi:multidrug transporter EmrE-like cation transporter